MQSSKIILTQTAGPQVPAKPSSGKFSKDTKIGHFLKFFKGGTKGKPLKSAPNLAATKTLRRKSGDLLIRYAKSAIIEEQFDANRGSKGARKAEFWQI